MPGVRHLGREEVGDLHAAVDGEAPRQRDLVGGPRADEYCVTTGASAPVYGGITQWRRIDDRFEFALTARAGRLFGDEVLSFEVAAVEESTVDDIAAHVDRLLR